MQRLERLVPLIGPTVAGPMGIVHLPRMWLKGILSAAGMLYEGYVDYQRGFNEWVVNGLGLNPDAWFAFLKTMPTYPQAEDYVRVHATKADPAGIAAVNATILGYQRPPESAKLIHDRAGMGASDIHDSARLVSIDDWCTVHEQLVAHRDGIEPIIPMVSSAQAGPLGIPHLPRLWFKAFLAAVNGLPKEWRTGDNCGFDKKLASTIGMDIVAATTYIHAELPSYVQFESWVKAHIPAYDETTRARWASEILAMKKPDDMATSDLNEGGFTGLPERGTILLNDIVDWRHMHDAVRLAVPAASDA
jgi:hypothetical protein